MSDHKVMTCTFDCVEELDKMKEILGDEFSNYGLILRLYVPDQYSLIIFHRYNDIAIPMSLLVPSSALDPKSTETSSRRFRNWTADSLVSPSTSAAAAKISTLMMKPCLEQKTYGITDLS